MLSCLDEKKPLWVVQGSCLKGKTRHGQWRKPPSPKIEYIVSMNKWKNF
jgi:hypothetical protein